MRRSFTLVETLLYMGLFAMFILVLSWIFVSILDVQLGSEATSSVEQDGRFVLNRMLYDIHRATTAVVSANQLQLTIGGVTNTYSLNGSSLQLVNNLGASRLNSFDTAVSGLTVVKAGNTVAISFTVTSQALVKSYQSTVGLR